MLEWFWCRNLKIQSHRDQRWSFFYSWRQREREWKIKKKKWIFLFVSRKYSFLDFISFLLEPITAENKYILIFHFTRGNRIWSKNNKLLSSSLSEQQKESLSSILFCWSVSFSTVNAKNSSVNLMVGNFSEICFFFCFN